MKSDRSSARTLHQLLGSPVASPKGFHKSFHVSCSPQVILLGLKLGWFTFRCCSLILNSLPVSSPIPRLTQPPWMGFSLWNSSTADCLPAHSMALSTVSNLLSRVLKSFSLDCFRCEKTNLVSVSVPLLPWLNPLAPYFHLRLSLKEGDFFQLDCLTLTSRTLSNSPHLANRARTWPKYYTMPQILYRVVFFDWSALKND